MSKPVDLYDSAYSQFAEQVLDAIRKETYGIDLGQTSWITADEYDRILPWLQLSSEDHVLEVGSGSGGPALYLANKFGCRLTGIDANESGVANANEMAAQSTVASRIHFEVADATGTLPFDENSFDGVVCFDAMNHFQNRLDVLREWHRVLRPGHRALFTDPVVITGPVTFDELAVRSSIGLFLFVPREVNEQLIEQARLRLIRQEDVTDNAAMVSGRWHRARADHKDDLIGIEGEDRFEGLQKFLAAVHTLTSEKRLSRIAYLVEKPAG